MAALAEIITPARTTEGVISLDIARVLMAMLPESLAAPLERTIFDASLDPGLV